MHALGELVEAIPDPFAPLGLAGHLAVPRLNALFLHGQGPVNLWGAGTLATDKLDNSYNQHYLL